ncbi:MAG: hypothetical protein COV45_00185 [Deltaproteobacteria bacterium CG11_big_fil_rev_8_21_14_0_20_47_16]|nr:MAG: hypothetical protein COV45_00185 [Deltaproteobacteria bacterium CG11_big_fil_rev_8_21_14_0_20_47_16]
MITIIRSAFGVFFLLIATVVLADPNPFPIERPPVIPPIPTVPTIGFAQSEGNANESLGQASVTIVLSQPTSNQVSVFYRVSGSASGESDYSLQNGVIAFAPGLASKTLTFPIKDDKAVEGDETLTITLSDPQNAMLGQSNYTLTIHDNDKPATP